jgi:hypothetical protein
MHMKLIEAARKIEKQLSNPMGDGGVDLDLLAALRVAIAEETETTGTDTAVQALAVERSGGMLRAMIETDAHVRAGEYLAALGAAAALENNIRQLVELLTVVRDVEAAKKEKAERP